MTAGMAGCTGGAALSGRAVFLDRDGVLNRALVREGRPYPPATLDDLDLLPGVVGACAALRRAGLTLVVVTNQPDIARGTLTWDRLEGINRALSDASGIDDIRVCPHDDEDGCGCRKPRPGLLVEAARDLHIDLGRSFMVGDRWRDVEAGRAAGCVTIHVDNGYAERKAEADFVVDSLEAAVPVILDRIDQEAAHGAAGRRR